MIPQWWCKPICCQCMHNVKCTWWHGLFLVCINCKFTHNTWHPIPIQSSATLNKSQWVNLSTIVLSISKYLVSWQRQEQLWWKTQLLEFVAVSMESKLFLHSQSQLKGWGQVGFHQYTDTQLYNIIIQHAVCTIYHIWNKNIHCRKCSNTWEKTHSHFRTGKVNSINRAVASPVLGLGPCKGPQPTNQTNQKSHNPNV